MRPLYRLLLLPFLLLAGCDDDDPSGPGGPALDCSGEVTPVEIEVSAGTTLDFDWEPRCRVAMLGVEAEDGDRWWIGSEDENLIEPPVRYGVTPAGVPGETAQALIDGETYSIVLWIVTDDGGAYIADVTEFTR